MSRATAIRRRRREDEAWLSVCRRAEDDAEGRCATSASGSARRLARVRDELAEVEGWYRLLQENHATLQDSERRASRRTTELQAEANRLEAENHELRAVASAGVAEGRETRNPAGGATMTMRYARSVLQRARNHKWAFAATMAIATLLARDPGIRGVLGQVAGRVRQAVEGDDVASRDVASGFVRYAAMLNSRDQAERAKAEYNAEATRATRSWRHRTASAPPRPATARRGSPSCPSWPASASAPACRSPARRPRRSPRSGPSPPSKPSAGLPREARPFRGHGVTATWRTVDAPLGVRLPVVPLRTKWHGTPTGERPSLELGGWGFDSLSCHRIELLRRVGQRSATHRFMVGLARRPTLQDAHDSQAWQASGRLS